MDHGPAPQGQDFPLLRGQGRNPPGQNTIGTLRRTGCARGGMEAIYIDLPERSGFGHFARIRQPIGRHMSAKARLRLDAEQRAGTA